MDCAILSTQRHHRLSATTLQVQNTRGKVQRPLLHINQHWCPSYCSLDSSHIRWRQSPVHPLVAIVLGPLINLPPFGNDIGHDLGNLGIDFYVLAQPLGKLWTSHHIYLLITPLFNNTWKLMADKLVHRWDDDWSSIYQFDHGLKACQLIAIANLHKTHRIPTSCPTHFGHLPPAPTTPSLQQTEPMAYP